MVSKKYKSIRLFRYILFFTLVFLTPINHIKMYAQCNNIKHNVPFISQNEQDYLPDESCCVACVMMMLLFYVQQNKLSSSAIPDYKTLCIELKTNSRHGTYLHNILSYFDQNNWQHHENFTFDQLAQTLHRAPIAVFIKDDLTPGFFKSLLKPVTKLFEQPNHSVLLIGANEKGFSYLDPEEHTNSSLHRHFISYEYFKKCWTGNAYQLLI